jgi:hypothetical protein
MTAGNALKSKKEHRHAPTFVQLRIKNIFDYNKDEDQ